MGIIAKIVGEENWVAVAEQMGEFEVATWFGKKRASLNFGSWGDLVIRVFGDGPTIDEATKACVLKARKVLNALAEHAPRKM